MDFDGRLWPLAGGFGRYTRLVAAASWLPNVALALGFFSELLYTAAPGGPCGGNNTGATLSNCTENCSHSLSQGWLHNNIVTQWDLACGSQWKVPLEQICYLIGWLVGYIIFGCICDRLGRRAAFIGALVLALPLGVAVPFSPGYFTFLPLRAGFGATLAGMFLSFYIARLELCSPSHRLMVTMIGGFFWVAGELLLPGLELCSPSHRLMVTMIGGFFWVAGELLLPGLELCSPSHRLMVTMIGGFFWVAGELLLPGAAVLCRDWRILQGAITGTLLLLGVYWGCRSLFPESPRWLLATQQLDQCKSELRLFSSGNGMDVGEGFTEQQSLCAEIDSMWERYPRPRYYNICSIFGTRLIWRNALILGFTAFIGCGIRPCFARNLRVLGPTPSAPYFLQAGSEVLACIALCVSVNRCGRRTVLLLCTILTGLCSLLLLALTQYLFAGASLAISVLGSLCAHAMVMLSIFYASEVLPTVLRGSGLGLILGVSMLGRAALPLMELQQNSGFFLHHVVLSSFCILSVLSLLLLPETRRKSLPETLRHGDSLRRSPLHLSQTQDSVPLLPHGKARADYNPDSYAQLASATKKMILRESAGTRRREEDRTLSSD